MWAFGQYGYIIDADEILEGANEPIRCPRLLCASLIDVWMLCWLCVPPPLSLPVVRNVLDPVAMKILNHPLYLLCRRQLLLSSPHPLRPSVLNFALMLLLRSMSSFADVHRRSRNARRRRDDDEMREASGCLHENRPQSLLDHNVWIHYDHPSLVPVHRV